MATFPKSEFETSKYRDRQSSHYIKPLPASIELLELSKLLTKTDKKSFVGAFNQWQIKWDAFSKNEAVTRLVKADTPIKDFVARI